MLSDVKSQRKKRSARSQRRGARYDIHSITAEIERQRVRLGIEVKVISEDLKIDQRGWYKKALLTGSEFSLAEISDIADYLKAPPMWPFLSWEAAEMLMRRADHNDPGAKPRRQ